MEKTINENLAILKGEAEAALAKVNADIANTQKNSTGLQAKKVEIEAILADFTANYPTVVAVKPKKGPGK